MNILYYDINKVDFDTVKSIFEMLQKEFPEVPIIGLPKGLNFEEDVDTASLIAIRDIINKKIGENVQLSSETPQPEPEVNTNDESI